MTDYTKWPDFNMRGSEMDRVEAFVAASFAFAVTMLVISVGTIPESFDEFVLAVKTIPAFAASFAIIVWIWHTHASWCKRYGLEDGVTVVLSALLVFLVLIYIYPLRLMMQGFFSAITQGFIPSDLEFRTLGEARFMFAFYATGFLMVCLNFVALYFYAYRLRDQIGLTVFESFDTKANIYEWIAGAFVACLTCILALVLPGDKLGWSGYANFLLFPVLTGLGFYQASQRESILTNHVNQLSQKHN